MTTLSASRTRGYTNNHINGLPILTSTTIWGGAAVGIHPITRAVGPLQGGHLFVGFARSSVNHVPGQQRDTEVTLVETGQVTLDVSGAVQADVGKDVYATDDNTFTLGSTGASFIGVAKQLVSAGKLLVEISPPFNLNAVRRSSDGQSLVSWAGNRVLTAPEQNNANSLYVMGDSLAANGWITTSNTYFALPGEGPLNWCNALLRAPFDIQGSVAASGKTLAQVITEQLPTIAALSAKPRYAFLVGGHNDLYSDSESAATVYARMVSVIETLIGLGVTPIWSTVWARSYSALPTVQHMQLNDMLRRYAYLTRAGLFYDGFEATADQTTSITNEGRLPLASYYYDSSIHINNLLAFMVGKYMASRIGDRVFNPNAFAVGQEDATFSGAGSNLLANPAFRGTGGTVSANCTGTMPDSWTIDWATRTGSGSAAAAIVDFTDPTSGLVIGESIQVTISGTPSANDVLRITQASGIHGNLVGGNVVQAEGILELASPAAVSECYIRAQTNTSEATNWGANIQTPVALVATGQLYARTREMTVLGTGAASAARYDLRMKFNGNGSGTVLTFTRPRFRKVS